jgi:WW domain
MSADGSYTDITNDSNHLECLACTSAQIPTLFCSQCCVSKGAAINHRHHISNFVSPSDVVIFDPEVSVHGWDVRKSAIGITWYHHKGSKLKTFEKPKPPIPVTQPQAFHADSNLPDGWEEIKDPDGRLFYYHRATKVSKWTRPEGNQLPTGWVECTNPDGRTYYLNTISQATTWDRPGGSASLVTDDQESIASTKSTLETTEWSPTDKRQSISSQGLSTVTPQSPTSVYSSTILETTEWSLNDIEKTTVPAYRAASEPSIFVETTNWSPSHAKHRPITLRADSQPLPGEWQYVQHSNRQHNHTFSKEALVHGSAVATEALVHGSAVATKAVVKSTKTAASATAKGVKVAAKKLKNSKNAQRIVAGVGMAAVNAVLTEELGVSIPMSVGTAAVSAAVSLVDTVDSDANPTIVDVTDTDDTIDNGAGNNVDVSEVTNQASIPNSPGDVMDVNQVNTVAGNDYIVGGDTEVVETTIIQEEVVFVPGGSTPMTQQLQPSKPGGTYGGPQHVNTGAPRNAAPGPIPGSSECDEFSSGMQRPAAMIGSHIPIHVPKSTNPRMMPAGTAPHVGPGQQPGPAGPGNMAQSHIPVQSHPSNNPQNAIPHQNQPQQQRPNQAHNPGQSQASHQPQVVPQRQGHNQQRPPTQPQNMPQAHQPLRHQQAQTPNHQQGPQAQRPNQQQGPQAQKPNQQGPQAQRPNQQQGPHTQKPNQQQGPHTQKPQQQGPHTQRPNQQHGPHTQRPNQQQGPHTQRPNQQHGPHTQRPNQQQGPHTQRPNQQQDPQPQRPNPQQNASQPQRPNQTQFNQRPNQSQPQRPQSQNPVRPQGGQSQSSSQQPGPSGVDSKPHKPLLKPQQKAVLMNAGMKIATSFLKSEIRSSLSGNSGGDNFGFDDNDNAFDSADFSNDGGNVFDSTDFSNGGNAFDSTDFSNDGGNTFDSTDFSNDGGNTFDSTDFSNDGGNAFDSANFSNDGGNTFDPSNNFDNAFDSTNNFDSVTAGYDPQDQDQGQYVDTDQQLDGGFGGGGSVTGYINDMNEFGGNGQFVDCDNPPGNASDGNGYNDNAMDQQATDMTEYDPTLSAEAGFDVTPDATYDQQSDINLQAQGTLQASMDDDNAAMNGVYSTPDTFNVQIDGGYDPNSAPQGNTIFSQDIISDPNAESGTNTPTGDNLWTVNLPDASGTQTTAASQAYAGLTSASLTGPMVDYYDGFAFGGETPLDQDQDPTTPVDGINELQGSGFFQNPTLTSAELDTSASTNQDANTFGSPDLTLDTDPQSADQYLDQYSDTNQYADTFGSPDQSLNTYLQSTDQYADQSSDTNQDPTINDTDNMESTSPTNNDSSTCSPVMQPQQQAQETNAAISQLYDGSAYDDPDSAGNSLVDAQSMTPTGTGSPSIAPLATITPMTLTPDAMPDPSLLTVG